MTRRWPLTADLGSLETLAAEAARRGTSLDALLTEAVDEKAARIRGAARARVGLGRSRDRGSAARLTAEPVAEPPA